MKYEVKDVVCDYGIYENDKLVLIVNDYYNAKLIVDILKADSEKKKYSMCGSNKKIDKKVSNYISAVHFLIDNLEYMMEEEDFNIEKLQKRIGVVKKFEEEF